MDKKSFTISVVLTFKLVHLGPYYKSKLELKSNSSEIMPVNF